MVLLTGRLSGTSVVAQITAFFETVLQRKAGKEDLPLYGIEDYRGLPKVRVRFILTFVDYEKVFDSIETNVIVLALVDQGGDPSSLKPKRCSTRRHRVAKAVDVAMYWVMEITGLGRERYTSWYITEAETTLKEDEEAETWPDTVATSKALRTTHRALERRVLKEASTGWADMFVARMDQLSSQLGTRNGSVRERRCQFNTNMWITLARDRNGWKQCCSWAVGIDKPSNYQNE
ncbi:unnamed protein product [Strongylus vulgaris]|uniref:Reverse transcriptase domain-containing protein n=1 Tax=Strongylus vulgaris TaxID=40348 RepID=A0A3P7J5G1_STRVU|nr:unnamed protein product [Strongylus vulgaris]